MHGIGGHIEAYSKNVVPLGKHYHVVAFDFVGHGLSEKKTDIDYTPHVYVEQLLELMDALGIEKAHISGESLGGMIAGFFAIKYPHRINKAILNTTGGIPIVTEKGRQDLKNLAELSARNFGKLPTPESVHSRMQWLIYEGNWNLLTDELIDSRLALYINPDFQKVAPLVFSRLAKAASGDTTPDMVELEKIKCDTLLFWTLHNPIHDVAAAKSALPRLPRGKLYVMKAEAAHWPQYEAPQEFNDVVHRYLQTGEV
ncbi:alpha/beta fold hydrolase [Methylocella tundrae]|nr:alpha/beta hydrolase [Methylocella tundrae]